MRRAARIDGHESCVDVLWWQRCIFVEFFELSLLNRDEDNIFAFVNFCDTICCDSEISFPPW